MAPPAPDRLRGDLALRVVSALVLAPVVLAAAWFGQLWFTCLVGIVMTIAGFEWCRLTGVVSIPGRALIIGAGPAVAVIALLVGPMTALAAGVCLAVAAAVAEASGSQAAALRAGGGVVYLVCPATAMIWLRESSGGEGPVVIWLLLVNWATDSAAYFVGRAIGGPRLAPRLSPKKTWAGLAGGVSAAAAVGAGAGGYVSTASLFGLAVLGGVLGVVGQVGDLLESAVKRVFGAKDAGHLIPGHGGILDRIDGLMLAAPVLALVVLLWRETGGALWP